MQTDAPADLWLDFQTTHQCKPSRTRTCPYLLLTARMARGCKENTSSGTARRCTGKWNCSPSATRGFPVLVFPTSGGRFCEYEDRGMVNALRPKIDRGELQVICVDSVDQESWYNRCDHPADRLHRQNAFDAYLAHEVAPFIRDRTSWPQMGTTGCSFGGYHAINFALRHPDLVTYAVSMSGAFDIPQAISRRLLQRRRVLAQPARLPAEPVRRRGSSNASAATTTCWRSATATRCSIRT